MESVKVSEETEQLMEDLGLKTETVEIPDFEKLEKAEMYDNIRKIAEALESNQRTLLELLTNILKGMDELRQAVGQLAVRGVPSKETKEQTWFVPQTQIQPMRVTPKIDWQYTRYRISQAPPTYWKMFAWKRKTGWKAT